MEAPPSQWPSPPPANALAAVATRASGLDRLAAGGRPLQQVRQLQGYVLRRVRATGPHMCPTGCAYTSDWPRSLMAAGAFS